jgi:hypothetical protein
MKYACLLTAIALCLPLGPAQADINRGITNYRAVMSGEKALKDLSAEELREVLVVYRAQRPQAPTGSSEQCHTAWDDAVSKANELADQAKKLSACAARRDFDDVCDTELRHARNAQDDYESAASSAKSDCAE